MKQYTKRKSERISFETAFGTPPSLTIFIQEKTKTYMHRMVEVDMNMKKNL